MELRKSQILLAIYERLRKGEKLRPLDIESEFGISRPTFHRYIAEIRAFLVNENISMELLFVKAENYYCLRDYSI